VQIVLALPDQNFGCWDLAVYSQQGTGKCQILGKPDTASTENADPNRFQVSVQRQERRTTYELALPMDVVGLGESQLETGIRFNIAVHDNDGRGYKGWMELAPGAVRKASPQTYPLTVLRRDSRRED